jgi:anti-anti-sigma factor
VESLDRRPTCWDGHIALVHDSERQRRIGVADWARCGLDLGAKVLYIEPEDVPPERSLLGVLEEHALRVEEALADGRLEIFTASDEVYSPTWQEGVTDEALAVGYPSVRWSGEERTAWSVMSPARHTEIEWETDLLCETRPVSIMCQYSAHLPQPTLETVCAVHGAGVRDSQLQALPTPEGLALAGSADAANDRLLRSTLVARAATAAADGGRIIVDLGELEFLDVAGARALWTGTTAHRLRGGTVRLTRPLPRVDRMLRLLGVQQAPGFEMEDAHE